ncbi:MAG: hypothetical protein AAFY72_06860 [Cyanobacteria bacterium J06649_4]
MTFVFTDFASKTSVDAKSTMTVSIPNPVVPDTRFGSIPVIRNHSASLNRRGEQHIYEFQSEMGRLSLRLAGKNVQGLDMLLLVKNTRLKVGSAPNAEPIVQAADNGLTKNIQIEGLGRGTYYVIVQKNSAEHYTETYSLAIHRHNAETTQESEPNNTPRKSDELGGDARIPLVGSRHVQGQVSAVYDQIDHWRFQLDKPSYFEGYIESERGFVALEILDENRNVIKHTRTNYPQGQGLLQCDRLFPGTYYARIRPIGPVTTDYKLRLEGHPVYAGNLSMQMHRITAIDDFERIGQRQADFYYRLTVDGVEHVSQIFENKDDVSFPSGGIFAKTFTRQVNINKQAVPIAIALYEQDIRKTITADISPNAGERELHLSYDTLTGEISGKGLTVKREDQHITVQGNQKPRARITFEVHYATLITGEVSL